MLNLLMFFNLAIIAGGVYYFSKVTYGDGLAPIGLFFGVNLGSLALNQLHLLPLRTITIEAYALIAAGLFSFLLGALLSTPSLMAHARTASVRNRGTTYQTQQRGLVLFYYFTASLATLGWLIGLYLLSKEMLLARLLLETYVLQSSFQRQYVGYLNLLGIIVVPAFILLMNARRHVSLLSVCFLTSAILGLLLAGNKSYLIFSLVSGLLVWCAIHPGHLRVRHLCLFILVVIAFMAIYDQVIDVFVSQSFEESQFPESLAFLQRPYLYVVGSWSAMSALIESPPPQPVAGFLSFHFIWKILGSGLNIISPVPDAEPFLDIGPSIFNVYSLIGGFYWDYGPIGVLLGCLALGYVSTWLYLRARKAKSWCSHLASAIFSYGIFISFFLYYYRFNMVFLLIYVVFIGGACVGLVSIHSSVRHNSRRIDQFGDRKVVL